MKLPHTVTVYNVSTEADPATFEEKTVNYITILRGVLLDAVKGTNVIKSGLEGADAVTLHIPFDVEAVDGITGKKKTYCGPVEFWNAEDKSGLWTLSPNKRSTFFIKGEVVEDKSEEYINLSHDDVYTVTKVDEKNFGGLKHWEVGGA